MRQASSQNFPDSELTFNSFCSEKTKLRTPNSDCFLSLNGLDKPKSPRTKKKSLVLSLDKSLLITQTTAPEYSHISVLLEFMGLESIVYVTKRPGLREFLTQLRKYYNIYIFTTNTRAYAEALLDALHLKRYFTSILGREDCRLVQGPALLKDLSKIGDTLDNIVLIDDSSLNTSYYWENSIKTSTFTGDISDTELLKLLPFLQKLAEVPDVRSVSTKFVFFNAGSNIHVDTPRFKDTQQKHKNSPKAIINKFLSSFFPNSELEEQAGHKNRDYIKTIYAKPKNPSSPLKIDSLKQIDVKTQKPSPLKKSLTQKGSPVSTRTSDTLPEDYKIEFLTSKLMIKGAQRSDEEGNHSVLMDETSQGQRRKNFLIPSLPMRIKSARTMLF